MNYAIHRIPATLHKPRFPSCAILFPQGIYQDESHDATSRVEIVMGNWQNS